MLELGLQTGTIATRNEDERINTGVGTIEVAPAWRYLLDLAEPVVMSAQPSEDQPHAPASGCAFPAASLCSFMPKIFGIDNHTQ